MPIKLVITATDRKPCFHFTPINSGTEAHNALYFRQINDGDSAEYPACITERILEYREALGMTVFGLRMHWVGMPHALNLKSLGLFCETVLPALQRG
jgi:hypothetical protein